MNQYIIRIELESLQLWLSGVYGIQILCLAEKLSISFWDVTGRIALRRGVYWYIINELSDWHKGEWNIILQ